MDVWTIIMAAILISAVLVIVGIVAISWLSRRFPNEVRAFINEYERRRGRL